MKDPRDIIIRPVVTERSMALVQNGKYTFVVDRNANKIDIKKAVEQLFDVDVVKVNTMNVPGKVRRRGTSVGRRPDWKKAIVTVAEGQRIRKFFDELT